ncbi:MAG: hypothetical protein AB1705_14180 [Verrucomicrobiota bacterium]
MLFRFHLLLFALLAAGCASSRTSTANQPRPFRFETDSFAYANELILEYRFDDATGQRTTLRRDPKPDYALHCFVVARAARQFFRNARFDPALPVADDTTYRRLIRQVVQTSARRAVPEEKKITIPGFASLRDFSAAKEPLLKAECGGAWQSYAQRGNWRLVFPFSRAHQEKTAAEFQHAIRRHDPPLPISRASPPSPSTTRLSSTPARRTTRKSASPPTIPTTPRNPPP